MYFYRERQRHRERVRGTRTCMEKPYRKTARHEIKPSPSQFLHPSIRSLSMYEDMLRELRGVLNTAAASTRGGVASCPMLVESFNSFRCGFRHPERIVLEQLEEKEGSVFRVSVF